MKVLIVYYSTYGNVYKMAQLVAEGVKEIPGAEPVIRTVRASPRGFLSQPQVCTGGRKRRV